MSTSSSEKIQRLGNTKQVSPAKKWCFTFNNYGPNDINKILSSISSKDLYIIGKEVGEQGTPHLQGFIQFHQKVRPKSVVKYTDKIKWIKANGTADQNYDYCSEDGDFVTNMIAPPKKNPIISINKDEFNGFQELVYTIFKEMLFGIHWFHEPYGGVGKSNIIHWLKVHHEKEILMLGQGKYADIINGVYNADMTRVKTVVIDLPRENTGFISLAAMESLLDMHIYNSKFEGGCKIFGRVNIIIMSNSYPKNARKLSARKWNIYSIPNCAREEAYIEDIQGDCIFE